MKISVDPGLILNHVNLKTKLTYLQFNTHLSPELSMARETAVAIAKAAWHEEHDRLLQSRLETLVRSVHKSAFCKLNFIPGTSHVFKFPLLLIIIYNAFSADVIRMSG